jgi:hypothetical protein
LSQWLGDQGWLVFLVYYGGAALILGAGMGWAQAQVLRRYVPHPALWIGANAFGMMSAMIIGELLTWIGGRGEDLPLVLPLSLGGTATGLLVLGAVTGWALGQLIHRPRRAETSGVPTTGPSLA